MTADFQLSCAPASLSGLCGTGTCSILSTGGFAGQVSLSCSGAPAGVRCGLGPNPLPLSANGTAVTGLTVSADPSAFTGPTRLRVVASAGGLSHSFDVSVAGGATPPASGGGVLTVFGCAGYAPGHPNADSLQAFTNTYVGAWSTPDPGSASGFCSQVVGNPDGSFVLEVERGCVGDGGSVYLTAGGLHACVAVTYHRGSRVFAEVLGRGASEACP